MSNIKIGYTYLDGNNFKNCMGFVVTNKLDIPIEDVESRLARKIDFDDFVPALIGLPSISPLDNPFIDVTITDGDHAFHEGLFFEETKLHPNLDQDIKDIVEAVYDYDERELELAEQAREYYYKNHKRAVSTVKQLKSIIEDK